MLQSIVFSGNEVNARRFLIPNERARRRSRKCSHRLRMRHRVHYALIDVDEDDGRLRSKSEVYFIRLRTRNGRVGHVLKATMTGNDDDGDDDDADAKECVGVGDTVICSIDDEDSLLRDSIDERSRDLDCVGVGIEVECSVDDDFEEKNVGRTTTMKEKKKQSLPSIVYVTPFFLWGTAMVAMKEVLPHTSPMFVASVRLIPAGLLLITFALAKNRKFPKSFIGWVAVSLFALVDGCAFQGFLAEGLARTSAGLGSVIIDSQPLTVAVLASIFFGETLGAGGIAGLAIGVFGLSLLEIPNETLVNILNHSNHNNNGDNSIVGVDNNLVQSFLAHPFESGEFWMLLAAQSMAVGTVMVRWVIKYVDPVMATGLHMFIGGIPLLVYSLVSEPAVYEEIANGSLTLADYGNLLYASLFGGALAYSLFFYFASSGNLTKLSSLTFLTPVFAVVGGYFVLGETLDAQQLVGAAVTLGGIYLVNKGAEG